MATNVLQAPFNLVVHNDHAAESFVNGVGNLNAAFDFEASSPPSSPCSPYAVDSSPPSSPLNDAFELDTSDVEMEPSTFSKDELITEVTSPDASPTGFRRSKTKRKDEDKDEDLAGLETSPAHPFSASTRAVKRPPAYSKDAMRPKVKRQRNESQEDWDDVFRPSYHVGGGIQKRDAYIQGFIPNLAFPTDEKDTFSDEEAMQVLISPSQDPEHALWEETLAQAVDAAECRIDLSGQGLTYIPSKIGDLSKLVVIRDSRTPARELAAGPRRTCSKSTNSIVFGAGKLGHREDEIHLFLARNNITSLPNELFNLDALVVLSLRANNLTEIPPLIGQLRNLRELNVANNKLRYLPAEILSLNLTSLAIDPNPFEGNPFAKLEPSKDRWFGPIERKHVIVPLVELVLRVLLAPSCELYDLQDPAPTIPGIKQQETVLEHCYDLPLQSDCHISPALRETLSSCVPKSVPSTQSPHVPLDASPDTRQPRATLRQRPCVSVCQSPRHLDINGGKFRKPVFVTHSEERLSWEKHIAGQKVGGETGIPVRWRGCSAGCLEYLGQSCNWNVAVVPEVEEDWSVAIGVNQNGEGGGGGGGGGGEEAPATVTMDVFPGPTLVQPSSRSDFSVFDSADVDLDD